MSVVSKVQNISTRRLHHPREQRGYMMLTLMLAIALMTMAMLAALPEISQQIRRDQEEELVHRGTEYMRAVQHYYRKFGRYPGRLEDLENTNNIRFLRKRYKDPMSRDPQTGKESDFKILHLQDVIAGGASANALAPVQKGVPGNLPGQTGAALDAAGQGEAGTPENSDSPDSSNPASTEGDSNSPSSNASTSNASAMKPGSGPGSTGSSAQTFGGSPIVGVASTSKKKTIRVFNDKNHYNDWYFIYDPTILAQRLLVGPWRPGTIVLNGGGPVMAPGQGTTQPAPGQPNTGPGTAPQSPVPQSPNDNSSNN
jgi:type II secretory pathway pseudopilin PulG